MINKKTQGLVSIAISCLILFSFPIRGQATDSSNIYSQGVSVGFVSMGTVSSLDFSVTSDYFIQGENIILKSGQGYRLEIANSTFKLYQNDILMLQTNNNITVKPTALGSYIKFAKEGYTRNFPGSITFKNNGSYFTPINSLKIEDYLKGVLPFEMGNNFPIEALKSQAVAARTYAITNHNKYIESGFNLSDDVNSQVYRGYVTTATNSNKAVDDTKGKILTYNNKPISAVFSSSNGGYTELAQNVWVGSLPYFPSIEKDDYDTHNIINYSNNDILSILKQKHPELNATFVISMDVVANNNIPHNVNALKINYKDISNNDQSLQLTNTTAKDFFGLLSNWFTILVNNNTYQFNVRYGHGVGMSQWGAYGRALANQSYSEILAFYYKNTNLEDISPNVNIISSNNRIGGQNRYSTSKTIAESINNGQVNGVVLSTGVDFPDALAGAVLAKKVGGPILLVEKSSTSADSKSALDYINSHLSRSGYIYLLGGEGVISSDYINTLKQMGFNESNIIRLGGANRQQTALKIATNVNNGSGPVVIATEADFPDALSISSIAALRGWPILLTSKDSLSSDVEKYISANKPEKVYIAGGTSVIADTVKNRIKQLISAADDSRVIRIGGSNRYETSRLINSTFIQDTDEAILATGYDYPDALSGSVYAAMNGSPILLVNKGYTSEAEKYLRVVNYNGSYPKLTIMGLSGAVSDDIVNYLTSLKQ